MDFLQNLPLDLVLSNILERLDYTSKVRVRAVCRGWRSLSPPPTTLMPWLWSSDLVDFKFTVRNLSTTPATHTTPCRPPDEIRSTFGNIWSRGPFALSMIIRKAQDHDSPLHSFLLYNPFSGEAFHLPWKTQDERPIETILVCAGDISGDPPNCFVAVCGLFSHGLYITSPGRNYWIKGPEMEWLYDMKFWEGKLYCIECKGKITAYDVNDLAGDGDITCTPRIIVPGLKREELEKSRLIKGIEYTNYCYLVESRKELLVAIQYKAEKDDDSIFFTLHKLDEKEGKLVPVYHLKGQMLFLDGGSSLLWPGPSPSEFFAKDCIYFVDCVRGNDEDGDENEGEEDRSYVRLGKFTLKNEDPGTSFAVFHPDRWRSDACCWISPTD